ncbi:GNAT family N-acetyltransferase [Methylobacter sp. S3L5C]|uniref:GNAT family N-acetyltransferase n=1 Tax=Methylobacter sp. S3L5C TaxID=2839024 RepID=UPI001FABF023|nr:GNAT family N-acetyltransferase [Methylobacter sp. S3L5C]UOA07682.1 GNAT family N-acetyltransferase [Methylobacter sp. S3L5C]
MKQDKHFQIIEADESHVDYLIDFGRRSFVDTYKGTLSIRDLEEYTNDAFSKSTITAEINDPSMNYFVCRDLESNLYGYSKLILSSSPGCVDPDRTIELQRLYVDESYRERGIGKPLLMHAELYAGNRGFRSIWLRVWDGNVIAQRKYLNWHYLVVGKEQYQVGRDARTVILMQKYCQTDNTLSE